MRYAPGKVQAAEVSAGRVLLSAIRCYAWTPPTVLRKKKDWLCEKRRWVRPHAETVVFVAVSRVGMAITAIQ